MFKGYAIILLITTAVLNYHPTGHYIVARIAELEIEKHSKELHKELIDLLKIISDHTKEDKHHFVESATFPDDIKYQGWTVFNSWHFVTQYLLKKGSKEKTKDLLYNNQDLVFAINESKKVLANTDESKTEDRFAKSFQLRYLIHLVGDVHQPLHNVSFVSEAFPDGDMGGNKFNVDVPGAKSLHLLWDKCLKLYKAMEGPLSDNHWADLNDIVDEITTKHTRSSLATRLKATGLSIRKWSEESRNIAAKQIYSEIKVGQKFTDDYLKSKKDLIDSQLAIAGYRLADTIIDILGHSKHENLQSHRSNSATEDDADWNYVVEQEDDGAENAGFLTAKDNTKEHKVQEIKGAEFKGINKSPDRPTKKNKIDIDSSKKSKAFNDVSDDDTTSTSQTQNDKKSDDKPKSVLGRKNRFQDDENDVKRKKRSKAISPKRYKMWAGAAYFDNFGNIVEENDYDSDVEAETGSKKKPGIFAKILAFLKRLWIF